MQITEPEASSDTPETWAASAPGRCPRTNLLADRAKGFFCHVPLPGLARGKAARLVSHPINDLLRCPLTKAESASAE